MILLKLCVEMSDSIIDQIYYLKSTAKMENAKKDQEWNTLD